MTAELLEHVVEEGQAGRDLHGPGAVDVDRDLTAVSLVVRSPSACRDPSLVICCVLSSRATQAPPEGLQEPVVLGGVPTVTRRHPARPSQLEQSRTRTPASSRPRHTSPASRPVGRKRMKLASDGHALDRQVRQRGRDPAPLLGHAAATRASISRR